MNNETNCPINVYTEWDPLEEVIVGTIDYAMVPDWHVSIYSVLPKKSHDFFIQNSGRQFPEELIRKAKTELENFAKILEAEGVKVIRPVPQREIQHPFSTPYWKASGGFYLAMPRDCFFAIGNTILEVPMAWRNRYFETLGYKDLLVNYFKNGANWISAPKPRLRDTLYDSNYQYDTDEFSSVINEEEPVFDAADFIRVGTDIIGQLSHVTNNLGVEWLRRFLGDKYKLHIYSFTDQHPMHIDTTIMPLAPGKVLINRIWTLEIPEFFKKWDIFEPPPSVLPETHPLFITSRWISTNILMLDEKRVVVEADEEPLIKKLEQWGFQPIKVPFKYFQTFGGSFHCATLDVRRKGSLRSYE